MLHTQTCSYITHIDTYTHISCQIIDQLASFIKHLVILSYKVFISINWDAYLCEYLQSNTNFIFIVSKKLSIKCDDLLYKIWLRCVKKVRHFVIHIAYYDIQLSSSLSAFIDLQVYYMQVYTMCAFETLNIEHSQSTFFRFRCISISATMPQYCLNLGWQWHQEV